MNTPEHLFLSESGDLFNTRRPDWHTRPPLRAGYSRTYRNIETGSQLRATLRAGSFSWPGGYPIVLFTADGEMVSPVALAKDKGHLRRELRDIHEGARGRIIGAGIYYEGETVQCACTGVDIESAYGVPE